MLKLGHFSVSKLTLFSYINRKLKRSVKNMIAKNAKDMSGQIIGNWLVIDRNEERTK